MKRNSPSYSTISLGDTKVVITNRARLQAMACCQIFDNTEWNSTILFSYEGEIPNMKIRVEEVIPHTIGEPGAADFNYEDIQEIVLQRMMELEAQGRAVMHLTEGVMHSHHKLGVFYSDMDLEDVLENSSSSNQYLSIVTDNKGDFYGKLGVRVLTDQASYRTMEGEVRELGSKMTNVVGLSDLIFEVEEPLEDDFYKLFEKMKKTSYATPKYGNYGSYGSQHWDAWTGS